MRIVRKSITEQVVDYIIEAIRKGYYKSGDRLPSQDELAKELEVSMVSIREAMVSLQCMGIVNIKQGDGTFVNENINLENIVVCTVKNALSLINYKNSLLYLLELRRIIEQHTVELAITRINKEELFILKEINIKMRECKDEESFLNCDLEFHLEIARLSKNPLLFHLLETIRHSFWRELLEVLKIPGLKEKAVEYHSLIYKAIESKNRKTALKLMLEHLGEPEKIMLKKEK